MTTWYGIVWFGMTWFGMVSHGLVWFGMDLFGHENFYSGWMGRNVSEPICRVGEIGNKASTAHLGFEAGPGAELGNKGEKQWIQTEGQTKGTNRRDKQKGQNGEQC